VDKIYLHCRYGDNPFFLPGEAVRGLTTEPQITPMPSHESSALLGITPLGGEAPPVFSAALFFDCRFEEVLAPEFVIFMDLEAGTIGLAVSEVVENLPETKLRLAEGEDCLIIDKKMAEEKCKDYIKGLRSQREQECPEL